MSRQFFYGLRLTLSALFFRPSGNFSPAVAIRQRFPAPGRAVQLFSALHLSASVTARPLAKVRHVFSRAGIVTARPAPQRISSPTNPFRFAIPPSTRRNFMRRLRINELCLIHQSLSCCGRENLPRPKFVRLGVQRIEDPHHPRDTGSCDHRRRCESCTTEKSGNKLASVRSATKSSPSITTWYSTTGIRSGWVERGETIIRTISRPYIGVVTTGKDQRERNDLRRYARNESSRGSGVPFRNKQEVCFVTLSPHNDTMLTTVTVRRIDESRTFHGA